MGTSGVRRRRYAVALGVVVLAGVPHAGADEAYTPHTFTSCTSDGVNVEESAECQVEAVADPETGVLRASHVAFGRTTGAMASAVFQQAVVVTEAAPHTFSVGVDGVAP